MGTIFYETTLSLKNFREYYPNKLIFYMRILIVANANQKDLALRFYNTDNRLYNGLVRNGHSVLFFSDRDQARLNAPLLPSRKLGVRKTNNALIQMIGDFRPNLVLFGHSSIIRPKTLVKIRDLYPDIPLAHFNVDAVFSPINDAFLKSMKGLFDAQFITTAGPVLKRYASKGKPVWFIPNITDRVIHDGRGFELDSPLYDMVFLAHNNPWDNEMRINLARQLQKSYPDIAYLFAGFHPYQGLRGYDFCEALRNASMGLNISRPDTGGRTATDEELYLYSSYRIAQLMGNGLLTFNYNKGGFRLQDLYEENELIHFESQEELTDKVRFYHQNPKERKEIARNGWTRAHHDFSVEKIADFILDKTLGRNSQHDYNWPTQGYEPD